MESTLPETADLARGALSATAFQDALAKGTWTYPTSFAFGDMNLSVYFDFILLTGLVITWVFQVIFKEKKPARSPQEYSALVESVKEKCLQGAKPNATALTTGVDFVTKEEYSLFLSTGIATTFVFFKIICGAEGVTSGYLYIIALGALFTRFIKQAGKDRVWMMFTTVLAVVALFLAFLAYTETIPGKKTGEKSGQNITYIFCGVLLLVAGVLKTIMTINARHMFYPDIANDEGKVSTPYGNYLTERAKAIVDGDWLYELSGVTVIVNASCLITFVFAEMITISLAATKWYAVPFYALYPMAIYNLGAVINGATSSKNVAFGPLLYNMTMVFLGTFILMLLQGHACSLPGSTVGEFATGEHPYCPRFGGLKRSTEAGLKIHKGWTVTLEIFAALFVLMAYWSMVFTSSVTRKTVEKLCGVNSVKYVNYA